MAPAHLSTLAADPLHDVDPPTRVVVMSRARTAVDPIACRAPTGEVTATIRFHRRARNESGR